MNENYLNKIEKNVTDIRHSLPSGVLLVAAAKTRLPDEVKAAIEAGIKAIGYNYVQEAERLHETIGTTVQWHMIGHLQRNKVKKAVMLFDMIETIDSVNLAEDVNKHCALESKVMPVLIEINSGKESNKTGVLPEHVERLILQINNLPNLKIQGLMTMGPRFGNPEDNFVYRLKSDNPDKKFYPVNSLCEGMNTITLEKVKYSLGKMEYKVHVPEKTREKAEIALDKMLMI